MRVSAFGLAFGFLLVPGLALGQGVPDGTYVCLMAPPNSMLIRQVGDLVIGAGTFSGPSQPPPAPKEGEAPPAPPPTHAFTARGNGGIEFPVEFATNIRHGKAVVEASFDAREQVIQATITDDEDAEQWVTCSRRPD